MATIVNYGIGNLFSVKKGLEQAGFSVVISSDKETIRRSDLIVFPGVGSHKAAMMHMQQKELLEAVTTSGNFKFGICLGMQLMYEESEEGGLRGLGLLKGKVVRLKNVSKVPHMGWNVVNGNSPLLEGVNNEYFYFAHSYYKMPEGRSEEQAFTEYDGTKIVAVVCKGKICGTQFHPEKSHKAGLKVLKNLYQLVKR